MAPKTIVKHAGITKHKSVAVEAKHGVTVAKRFTWGNLLAKEAKEAKLQAEKGSKKEAKPRKDVQPEKKAKENVEDNAKKVQKRAEEELATKEAKRQADIEAKQMAKLQKEAEYLDLRWRLHIITTASLAQTV